MRLAALFAILVVSSCSSRDDRHDGRPPMEAFAARLHAAIAPTRFVEGFALRDAVAPTRADGELVFRGGMRITPLDVANVSGEVRDGAIRYAHAVPNGDLLVFQDERGVEELRVLDAPSSILRWRVTGATLVADGDA